MLQTHYFIKIINRQNHRISQKMWHEKWNSFFWLQKWLQRTFKLRLCLPFEKNTDVSITLPHVWRYKSYTYFVYPKCPWQILYLAILINFDLYLFRCNNISQISWVALRSWLNFKTLNRSWKIKSIKSKQIKNKKIMIFHMRPRTTELS